jgi:hypothetical protein
MTYGFGDFNKPLYRYLVMDFINRDENSNIRSLSADWNSGMPQRWFFEQESHKKDLDVASGSAGP